MLNNNIPPKINPDKNGLYPIVSPVNIAFKPAVVAAIKQILAANNFSISSFDKFIVLLPLS